VPPLWRNAPTWRHLDCKFRYFQDLEILRTATFSCESMGPPGSGLNVAARTVQPSASKTSRQSADSNTDLLRPASPLVRLKASAAKKCYWPGRSSSARVVP
jgi:hypothetical protein